MESQILQNFIEEAEIYLPMIRNGILVCNQEGNISGELETALRCTQAIKVAALSVGFDDIGESGENLELELTKIVGKTESLSALQTRDLLDNLARLEAKLADLHFSADDFSMNLDGFIDESFMNLGFDSSVANAHEFFEEDTEIAESTDENELEGFEIDEEMLEIFAEEADDLLGNINTHLEVLKSKPNDREALLEIRRNAHTLKGSAGIVGLKSLSSLAHRVEDLLDYLAEKQIEGDENIFKLLQSSTDCLSAIAGGENSPELTKKVGLLYRDFDKTLHLLNGGKVEIAEEKPAEIIEVKVKVAELPNANQPAAVNSKSVVRVSLEKLDELVRLVGDLVISRSVFEQRLIEFEKQIGELQHSTGRLMRSTNKLETDFEANMLQVPNSRFQMPNSNVSLISQNSAHNFDSLEFDRYTEFHQTTRELLETTGDASAINNELDKLRGNLELLFGNQSQLIEEMHDKLLRLRMVKFGSLSARLQRTVRVTCEQELKQAELIIEGEQTEVDTQILDLLIEPLLHLLRNSVAHGIESPDTRRMLGKSEKGKIHLRLHSEGTHVIMTVSDDGRGISAVALREKAVKNNFITKDEADAMSDEEAFSLTFLPGLTTAEKVSQTAGRGVGMNIIKTSVLRGQGTITIASEPQKGTTFTIRMPMALAITRGLLVKVAGQTFAFPLKLVKQVSEIPAEELKASPDFLSLNDVDYSILNLATLLGLPSIDSKKENIPMLLLETLETPRVLIVDEILRAEEIVIKPLGAPLQNFSHLLGATILGDGNVVPVLDLIHLLKNYSSTLELNARENSEDENLELELNLPDIEVKTLSVMIVDDSPSVRHINSKLVKNAGWESILAKDGLEALEVLQSSETLPDVVLTDVEMPRMDGYELLATLKNHETLNKIPVIMITSRASEKHQQKAVELGVSEYLTKPYADSVLLEAIRTLANF
jgi:chemosensory pili system protein ChpA (sensor histidine kinase/response regulator)